jgi:glucose/arabinose dehydrogenase
LKKIFILLFLLAVLSGCISENPTSAPAQPGPLEVDADQIDIEHTEVTDPQNKKPVLALSTETPASAVSTTLTSSSIASTSTTTSFTIKLVELPDGADYELVKIADGFEKPLYLTNAGDGSKRLFIVEQRGTIRIIDRTMKTLDTPFLDISTKVGSGSERGLLGLAFHPDYPEKGFFYVHNSDLNGDTVISRFKASIDPNEADMVSEEVLLTLKQPFAFHNGGQIAFGPDGYLYIGLGDGGSGGDRMGNGQDPSTLLGSILRINVDEDLPYTIPPGNPFAHLRDLRSGPLGFETHGGSHLTVKQATST